jgi:hypothetical protein
MYRTLFDVFAERSDLLGRLPRWQDLQPRQKALIAGVSIILITLLCGAAAIFTPFHYATIIALGVFLGVVVSRVLTQFLAPKIQSLATGFLGGVTSTNIASKEASVSKAIGSLGVLVNKLVDSIVSKTPTAGADLTQPITFGVWIAVLTALVIVATNAYYANLESSTVGDPVAAATPTLVPVVAPAGPQPALPGI